MIIQIRDKINRKIIGLFGEFESMIWTERFQEYGDFELICSISKRASDLFMLGRFITVPTSKNMMIITKIEYQEDKIKITGKSSEYILNRRIIYEWRNTEQEIYFKNLLTSLFYSAISNPTNEKRRIENVSIKFDINNVDDIKFLTNINRGDKLGDAFYSLCIELGYGLRAEFDFYTERINYIVYEGKNKKHLMFSSDRFNFERTTYVESVDNFFSDVLVGGDGEGTNRKMVTVSRMIKEEVDGEIIMTNCFDGIDRVEGYVDARDIQKKTSESMLNYKERLKERGIAILSEHNEDKLIDGDILNSDLLELGDLVTVKDGSFRSIVRISEIIQSWSSSGYKKYPTFRVENTLTNDVSESFNVE